MSGQAGADRRNSAAVLFNWLVPAVALVLASTYFVIRGPLRAGAGGMDFQYYAYVEWRTFVLGGNPYRAEDQLAAAATISDEHRTFLLTEPNVGCPYPPGFFVLAPLALLPLQAAWSLWMAVEFGAFLSLMWAAVSLFGAAWAAPARPWFLTGALSLAPVHTAFAVGNPSILFVALTAILLVCMERRAVLWGGLVLGVLSIKPTFAIPAAVLALILGHWRMVAWSSVVAVLISVPAFWHIGVKQALTGFLDNQLRLSGTGMNYDGSFSNPQHYQILNLQAWSHALAGPRWATLIAVIGVGGLAGSLVYYRRLVRGHGRVFYWTLACTFVCLSLYHRSYDAALLIIPLAAMFELLRQGDRRTWLWGAALAVFSVPVSTFLHLKLGAWAHQAPPAEALFVRLDTLALIALAAASITALHRAARGAPSGATSS